MADAPYVYQEFPKHLFHPTHTTKDPNVRVVASQADQDALGPGWLESPPENPTVQVDLEAENAALRAQLAELQAGSTPSKKK